MRMDTIGVAENVRDNLQLMCSVFTMDPRSKDSLEDAAKTIDTLIAAVRERDAEIEKLNQALLQRLEASDKRIAELEALVEKAFNEGFGEGMDDVLRQSGGKNWYDSRSRAALEKK